jgi:hypothetical protein
LKFFYFFDSVQGARCSNQQKFPAKRRIFKHCKQIIANPNPGGWGRI